MNLYELKWPNERENDRKTERERQRDRKRNWGNDKKTGLNER